MKENTSLSEQFYFPLLSTEGLPMSEELIRHKEWLSSIRHERPSTSIPFKIGVYIRFFNQTSYENYLDYHKKQYIDSISLCPLWELVDFYIDYGSIPPHMENAPEWSRLIDDCMDGRINLIITQKISNVSRDIQEVTICSRLLASMTPPIGIYFISEDLYTTASYYRSDLKDKFFLPYPQINAEETNALPDSEISALSVEGLK